MKFLDIRTCWRILRAHQWWYYKLPLALAVVFSMCSINNISAADAAPSSLLLISCGLISGFFVSLVNDITDLEQDKSASKTTPVMKLSGSQRIALLSFSILLVLGQFVFLIPLGMPAFCFAILNCVFVAYSVKPFRLKERGLAGLLCISFGEHLLPALLAVSLVVSISGVQVSGAWLASLCIWATFFGLRGIVWHQLNDLKSDKISGCKTLGVSLGEKNMRLIGECIVFPVEICAYLPFVYLSNTSLAFWFFIPYIIVDLLHKHLYGVNLKIVDPADNHRFILFDYYRIYFPIACLITASMKDSSMLSLLIGYLLLFGTPLWQSYRSLPNSVRWHFLEKLRRSRRKAENELTIAKIENLHH